jgi:hypothetical protein
LVFEDLIVILPELALLGRAHAALRRKARDLMNAVLEQGVASGVEGEIHKIKGDVVLVGL